MRTTETVRRSSTTPTSVKPLKKNLRTYKRFSFHPFPKLQRIEKLDCEYTGKEVNVSHSADGHGSPLSSPTYSSWLGHEIFSPKAKKSSDSPRKLKFFKATYFHSSSSNSQRANVPPPLPPRIVPKFLLSPKYHMFSDLTADFIPFRLVLFKVIGKNIWFRVIDAEEQARLLYAHEQLLEPNMESFLEEPLGFSVFEDVEHVLVLDVFLQTSPKRVIFQVTSRKCQFLLEALSSRCKKDFVNRMKFELEAKLNPIVTDRMLAPNGPGLLEKLYSLQHDGLTSKNRSFVDTITEISTRCLKYGGYIGKLQDVIQVKAKELDGILGKLADLSVREQELHKLTNQWLTLQKNINILEQAEMSTQKLLSRTESSQLRLRKGELTLNNNQTTLNSIQKTLSAIENTKNPGSTSLLLTVLGIFLFIAMMHLLYTGWRMTFSVAS